MIKKGLGQVPAAGLVLLWACSGGVGVVAHPYHAVTKDGGKFALENLPADTYTVEAWHEKAGTQFKSTAN